MKTYVILTMFCCTSILMAGDLNPPAAPGAGGTMKPLDQVEPRIAIPGSASPVTVLTINQSGSYYLTGDRHCSGTGIIVNADNVTLDLMGYSLIGSGSGTYNGIKMNGRSNIEIRSGTIRAFNTGIYEDDDTGLNFRILEVRCVANALHGIYLFGQGHLIKDCLIADNGNAATGPVYGIFVSSGSRVTGNIIRNNGYSVTSGDVYGIRSYYGCTLTDNVIYYNGHNAASDVTGIHAASGNIVRSNTIRYNGQWADGSVHGIFTSNGCTVIGNASYYNGHYTGGSVNGISVSYGCTVTGNTSYHNGYQATGTVYGIQLSDYDLVDQNTAYSNGMGAGSGINMDTTIATCVYGNNVAP